MKKFIGKVCVFLFFNFYSLIAFTQNTTIDSLKKVLQSQKEDTNKVNTFLGLSYAFFQNGNYSEVLQYANEALVLSKRLNFQKGQANAYKTIGELYGYQGNLLECRKNFTAALKIAEELKDKALIALLNANIGKTFGLEENYPEALKFLYYSLEEWEKMGNDNWAAEILSDIATILDYQKNYSESLESWFRALELYKRTNKNKYEIARAYTGIATIYLQQGKYQEALKNTTASQKVYEESGDKPNQFYVFQLFGMIGDKQADLAFATGKIKSADSIYNEALVNYNTALSISQESGDTVLMAEVYENLGSIYIKLNNFSKANDCLKKSLQLSNDRRENIKTIYSDLSKLDSLQGNYKQALMHYKMYILYRDSLVNTESTRKSEQARLQYDFNKKETAAKAAQYKKDAEAKRIKNRQYFAITALGIVVLAVVVIALIQFRNSKQKQKANIILENTLTNLKSTQAQLIQSEKMASLGELTAGIAHEIQNPLNFVNNFSEVNSELIDELSEEANKGNFEEIKNIAKDIKENEEKINHHGKRADSIVKGMLQHSQKSTGQKESTDVNKLTDEYLRLSFHGIRAKDKTFNANLKTDFDKSIEKINVIPQDIGRVLLNLYNNAFYAVNERKLQQPGVYEPSVLVSTKKVNDKVEITVQDNGNGIPQKIVDKIFQPFFTTKPTGQGTGLGLSLAYDIVKAHGGEIKVKTKDGEGAEFIIQLPIIA